MVEKLEALNSVAHRDLRIHPMTGAHPHFVQITLIEAEKAASCCPLFFAKSPETGRFGLGALFGFAAGEVLVEGANEANAAFLPCNIQRQGFFADNTDIVVDLADPRFAPGGTISLFDADGNPSDEMRLIQRAVGVMVQQTPPTQAFIDEMLRLHIIEPVDITLNFDDGAKVSLEGLYTISGDALNALADEDILRLFRKGWLQVALTIRGSLQQVAVLARRRNERLVGA
nr:SapC family protein [Novosphingobium sediminicola]